MIVIRLRGGLGNQLFEYAAGKSLAYHHGVPLKVDPYYYRLHPNRSVVLDRFHTDYEIATAQEINQLVGRTRVEKFFHKKTHYRYCRQAFAQPYYHFYPDFYQLPAHVYLSGYWQSERYFQPYLDTFREQLVPREAPSEANQKLIEEMNTTQSVSLHVRHGDYVAKPSADHFFAPLEETYYRAAITFIRQKISAPRFYVFSDNIEWCRRTFADLESAVFVDHNREAQSYWDLWLIAQCRHHVMANSSFSWWGAWLNKHSDKIVVAPQRWFAADYYRGKHPVYPERAYNLKDQLPDGWFRL